MTEEDIARAKALKRLTYLWEKGLGARISAKGQVSWLVQTWSGGRKGKSTRKVIGHYPVMTLEEARGVAARGQPTLLVDALNKYLSIRKKSGSRFWRQNEPRLRRTISRLGEDRLPGSITRGELRALLEETARVYPVAARTLAEALRPFWRWMVDQELVSSNPFESMALPAVPRARDRVLSHPEIREIWQCADEFGYPWGHFIKVLLLTGQRRTEVAEMSWSEIDQIRWLWTIPKERAKTTQANVVPLVMQTRDLIMQARELIMQRGAITSYYYVFSTHKIRPNRPIQGFSKFKLAFDRRCVLPPCSRMSTPWRFHDLRRTAATEMAGIGIPDHIIERILNHAIPGVRGVYNRYSYLKEKTEALERYARHIESLLRG